MNTKQRKTSAGTTSSKTQKTILLKKNNQPNYEKSKVNKNNKNSRNFKKTYNTTAKN
jgi:hypothetical protein